MKNMKNTESAKRPESAKQSNIKEFTKLEETISLIDDIDEYINKNGCSPFLNIQMNEENPGELNVDISKDFEEEMSKKYDNIQEIFNDYFVGLITKLVDDVEKSPEEFKDLIDETLASSDSLDSSTSEN